MDLNTNMLTYHEHEIEIRPPQVAEVVYALVRKWPRTVSLHDLSYALWGVQEPDGALNCIPVHISRARKQVAVAGMNIESISGKGYRLVCPGQPIATEWARLQAV